MTGAGRAGSRDSSLAPEAALLTLRAAAQPNIVSEFRHAVRDFARRHGAGERIVENVELAASEAVTNAVKYAYLAGEPGHVSLAGSVRDGWLEIRVTDAGHGFREGSSSGLGLGLAIIAQVTSDMTISQGSGGTTLRLRFCLR